ncbi:MAG: hypothetical protein ACO35F_11355, partial [Ilumatobacteraceae bacterium]
MERFTIFDNSVGGSIPDVLVELSNLKLFDVEKNALSGPAFVSLDGASSLESYRVSSNPLSGTIPDLSGTTTLKEVWAAGCEITGPIPESIGDLVNLGKIVAKSHLVTLQIVSLRCTKIDDVSFSIFQLFGGRVVVPLQECAVRRIAGSWQFG